jgi:hypothetical protein
MPKDISRLFAALRRLIASRWPLGNTLVAELLRNHEHQHVRLGYYQRFEPLKVEKVQAAYARDGEAFVAAAVENPWFYHTGGFHSVRHEFSRLARETATTSNRYEWLWLKRHPYATVFEPSSFAQVDDDEETNPRLATLGRRLAELAISARRSGDADKVWNVAHELRSTLDTLEERYEERDTARATRVFESLDRLIATTDRLRTYLEMALVAGLIVLLFSVASRWLGR